ncbi:hypothetical protein EDC01DRAFT_345886 [Geopyxis carbonaria]|nr:hypothetical protein EDC01DRAFT_345886 [Geopyxis carbonaria]
MAVKDESSVLAISIPYIAVQIGASLDPGLDTVKLLDYRSQPINGPLPNTDDEINTGIVVHKAWFLVINNDIIAISKSVADTKTTSPVSIPNQTRLGAFHTAMRGISELLEVAEREVLRKIRGEVVDFERRALLIRSFKSSDAQIQHGMAQSRDLLLKISALFSVVERQSELLQDLKDIFEYLGHSETAEVERARGTIDSKVLPKEKKEQMRPVLKILGETQNKRKALLEKLTHQLKVVRRSQKLYDDSTAADQLKETLMEQTMEATMMSVNAVERLDEAIIKQNLQAQSLQDEIEWQGAVLSMFTAVTVLFLPLGFFTAYFALDSVKSRWTTQSDFWMITGPITSFMVLVTLVIIFSQEYGWATSLKYWLTPWRLFWMKSETLSEQQKFEQERYLKSLPLYRVEVLNPEGNDNNYLQKPKDIPPLGVVDFVLQAFKSSEFAEYDDILTMGPETTKGEFYFDAKNGWLIYPKTYDDQYILCASVSSAEIFSIFLGVKWTKLRLPKDEQQLAGEKRAKFQIFENYLEWVLVPERKGGDEFEEKVSSDFGIMDGTNHLGISNAVDISQSEVPVDNSVKLRMVRLDAKLEMQKTARSKVTTTTTVRSG